MILKTHQLFLNEIAVFLNTSRATIIYSTIEMLNKVMWSLFKVNNKEVNDLSSFCSSGMNDNAGFFSMTPQGLS